MFEPNDAGAQAIAVVRKVVREALAELIIYCPNSRERSLALTKLEEAEMWAVKSIGTNPENCK